jgi:hypothetical protein
LASQDGVDAVHRRHALLIALGLLLHSVVAAPCPDLSGQYRIVGEDGYVMVLIAQTRCERVTIEWNRRSYSDTVLSRHDLKLDGKPHPDVGWWGVGTQRTSAAFVADTLLLVGTASAAGADPGFTRATFHLTTRGICTRFGHGRERGAILFAYRVVRGARSPTEDEREKLQAHCAVGRTSPGQDPSIHDG